METNYCLSDDYEHTDKTIEYVLENVLSNETIESGNRECFKLKELYNSILENTCNCESYNCLTCVHGSSYVLDERTGERVICFDRHSDLIYECSHLCKCKVDRCHNRVVQFGPRKHLKVVNSHIFKSKGVITMADIPKGAFICEYAGELLTHSEAIKRLDENERNNKMNYILFLKEHCLISGVEDDKELTTIVDPSRKGNIGRYLNHSCEPNCQIFSVRIDSPLPKIGRIYLAFLYIS